MTHIETRRGSARSDEGDEQPSMVAMTSADASPEQVVELTEIEAAAAERMTFFSDAVVAIAITLLALELPVPPASADNHAILDFVGAHSATYVAFLVSFWVIGGHWQVHHSIFRYVTRLGGRLFVLNMLWLLLIIITPVVTKLLTDEENGLQIRFSSYAAVQALQGALMALMVWQMTRHSLLRPGTPLRIVLAARGRSLATGVAFGVSIPASFLVGGFAYAFWFAVPVLWLTVVRTVQGRRHRRVPGSAEADRAATV